MKYLPILSIVVLLACNNDEINQTLPDCISEIVSDSLTSENLMTIQSQIVDDEQVYWLNTNAVSFDGAEFIVSASCDTLCFYCGECIEPECLKDYPIGDWVIIWER